MNKNVSMLELLLKQTGGAFRVPLKIVATILGIDPQTIHNQLYKGTFPLRPLDSRGHHKRVYFDLLELAAYLERGSTRGPGRPPKSAAKNQGLSFTSSTGR